MRLDLAFWCFDVLSDWWPFRAWYDIIVMWRDELAIIRHRRSLEIEAHAMNGTP